MNNKRFSFILGLFALIFSWQLVAKAEPTLNSNDNKNYHQAFLWQVEGQGMKQPSYLFGTIHLPDPRLFPLPNAVQKAINDSQFIFTEIAMNSLTQLKVMQAMQLPANETLESKLPKETHTKLVNYLQSESMDAMLPMLSRSKPWAVSVNVVLLKKMLKNRDLKAMDDLIYRAGANSPDKQHVALETAEEQLQVFLNMAEKDEIAILDMTLDMLAKPNFDPVEELLVEYLKGDEESLLKLMNKYQMPDPELQEKLMKPLLDDRNIKMVEKLNAHFKVNSKVSSFVAVGAAHYAGENNILKLLRKKGYKITRITR